MLPDFPRYLAAKQTVDDRALNGQVWDALAARLGAQPRVLDVGCGTGAMLRRMQRRGLLAANPDYFGLDSDPANIAAARANHPDTTAVFECADLYDLPPSGEYTLLVAAAFLDLLDLSRALPHLRRCLAPGGLAYFPINFDGLTLFEPEHPLDEVILGAYHRSMDMRPTGGHSRTGRRLFRALPEAGFEILAAGASDWVVHPGPDGRYPQDEAFFLEHILYFFEDSCRGAAGLEAWLADRRAQAAAGELVYIAHQLDFLALVK